MPRNSREMTGHLVEVFVPLQDADGRAFESTKITRLAQELTEKFGGVTIRNPMQGKWKEDGHVSDDLIIIMEVVVDEIDRRWWTALQRQLMVEFDQDEILIRSHAIERL